jgi:hypothetical protein
MVITYMIKIWVKEDLFVTLLYCNVEEEYAVFISQNMVLFISSTVMTFVHWIQLFHK